jgi:RNA polymerase sigma-70 factor, ECF subfamily
LPTAVVREAVIKLLGEAVLDRAADRSFLFASVRAMREVLVDPARRRAAAECRVPDALPPGRRHQA